MGMKRAARRRLRRYDVNAYVKELFLGYMEKYQEKGHYECIRPEMGGEG